MLTFTTNLSCSWKHYPEFDEVDRLDFSPDVFLCEMWRDSFNFYF